MQSDPETFLKGQSAQSSLSIAEIEALIQKREHARQHKDFDKSDDASCDRTASTRDSGNRGFGSPGGETLRPATAMIIDPSGVPRPWQH